MMVVAIVLSVVLKSLKDRLIFLILNMQLITSLTMYEVNFPPNIEIQINYVRSIIAGEMLKPDFVIGLIWPGKTLLTLFSSKTPPQLKGNLQSSGMNSGNIFVNLS